MIVIDIIARVIFFSAIFIISNIEDVIHRFKNDIYISIFCLINTTNNIKAKIVIPRRFIFLFKDYNVMYYI